MSGSRRAEFSKAAEPSCQSSSLLDSSCACLLCDAREDSIKTPDYSRFIPASGSQRTPGARKSGELSKKNTPTWPTLASPPPMPAIFLVSIKPESRSTGAPLFHRRSSKGGRGLGIGVLACKRQRKTTSTTPPHHVVFIALVPKDRATPTRSSNCASILIRSGRTFGKGRGCYQLVPILHIDCKGLPRSIDTPEHNNAPRLRACVCYSIKF